MYNVQRIAKHISQNNKFTNMCIVKRELDEGEVNLKEELTWEEY